MLLLSAGCASHQKGAAATRPTGRATPHDINELGKQFTDALAAGDTNAAAKLFISHAEWNQVIDGTDLAYIERQDRMLGVLDRLREFVRNAKFVTAASMPRESEWLEPGSQLSNGLRLKTRVEVKRNVRLWINVRDDVRQLEMGTLLNIDGAWRYIDEPKLRRRDFF